MVHLHAYLAAVAAARQTRVAQIREPAVMAASRIYPAVPVARPMADRPGLVRQVLQVLRVRLMAIVRHHPRRVVVPPMVGIAPPHPQVGAQLTATGLPHRRRPVAAVRPMAIARHRPPQVAAQAMAAIDPVHRLRLHPAAPRVGVQVRPAVLPRIRKTTRKGKTRSADFLA
jgi:hypothetical protein